MEHKKHPFKILYIEDEESIRKNYMQYLERHFIEVFEAEDGEEAYEKYLRLRPDILIVDINIPKLNGLELLKRIREKDHTTKAIVVTAYSDVEILLQATSLKLTEYVIKPISRSTLKKALERAIDELEKFGDVCLKPIVLRKNYTFDLHTKELFLENNLQKLSKKESLLLETFLRKKEKPFTYEELIGTLWQGEFEDKSDALRTLVKRLRQKLPENSIENIFGVGYRFNI